MNKGKASLSLMIIIAQRIKEWEEKGWHDNPLNQIEIESE